MHHSTVLIAEPALKALHFQIERVWCALPALYRRLPSAHVFHSDASEFGEGMPGVTAVLIVVPSDVTGDDYIEQIVQRAIDLSHNTYGTRGIDDLRVQW